MGIEGIVADRKSKEFCQLQNNRNCKPRKSRRRERKISPVQKLYFTCKEVFSSSGTGFIPPLTDIDRLQSVLDSMREEDVGLRPNMPYFKMTTKEDQVPEITYLHLYACEKFSIGIFCLPPSAVIPLHNHPGMTVFSKLLFGTMHIKSYDWAEDEDVPCRTEAEANSLSKNVRLAKVKVKSKYSAPCNISILYPADGGNMHCFTAVTACAVLDVLGPPYSDPEGRHCTYYHDFPFNKFQVDGVSVPEEEKEGYAWLQEKDNPENFTVVGAQYSGPKIIDN